MSCPNPGCSELLPAEKLDSHVNVDCPFRKVTCDYCKEETAANKVSQNFSAMESVHSRAVPWFPGSGQGLGTSLVELYTIELLVYTEY